MIGHTQAAGLGILGKEVSGSSCGQDYISLCSPTMCTFWGLVASPRYSGAHLPHHLAPNLVLVLGCFSCIPIALKDVLHYFTLQGILRQNLGRAPSLLTFSLSQGSTTSLAPDLSGRGKKRTFMLWARPRTNSERHEQPTLPLSPLSLLMEGLEEQGEDWTELEPWEEQQRVEKPSSSFNQHLHGWSGNTGCLGCKQKIQPKQVKNVYRPHVTFLKAVSPDGVSQSRAWLFG